MIELADRPLRVPDEIVLLHWWRMLRWFSNLRLIPRWHEHTSRFVMRLFRRLYYDGLTRTGKIILICCFIIFLFSYRASSGFLLFTAAFGLGILLWSALLGFIYRPRVTVQRDTPITAVAGQPLVSQIRVSNTGRLGLFNFSIREMIVPFGRWPKEWSRPHQLSLPAAQSSSLSVQCEAQKRGLIKLSGVAVQSYFPFFLTRFTTRIQESAEVYVLPETLKVTIPSLRHIADKASKCLAQGRENTRKGPSLDYAYSRPYQTGDSMRRLDHRASSRYGEPMSKVFDGVEEIRRDKVYLVVDLSLAEFQAWQRRPLDVKPLDERLALAVEIGLSARNEGLTLAALATGNKWHNVGNLLQFYQRIATCEPERSSASNTSLPASVLAEDGIHVLVVGRWTKEAEVLVERWQRAGILVLVFLIAESANDAGDLPVGSQFVEIQRNAQPNARPAKAGKLKSLFKVPLKSSRKSN